MQTSHRMAISVLSDDIYAETLERERKLLTGSPLRILVAHQVSRRRTGGMSRIMGFIHDQLSAAGHSVDYFCAEDIPSSLNGRKARFTFPLLVRRHAITAARAGRPYDLINVHEPSAAAISTLKRAAGNPVVVVTSHGVEKRGWELALQEARRGRESPSLKTRVSYPLTSLWQSRLGLKCADHIFCLNEEDREYLAQRLCIARPRITRIFPAADRIFASLNYERNYERARRLLFAGTWLKRKGVEDLAAAFTTLADKHPELTLVVLGGGRPQSEVHAAFPASLRDRVTCAEAASEDETAAAFVDADIFVLPSLFEGTPLTLIEAMMSGMPIVTTATCGMKDVIRQDENGLLVPRRSPDALVAAIESLVCDAEYRTRLGQTAQAEALEKYTWERVSLPVRSVYEQLCQRATS